MRKKLIEIDLPLDDINRESAREKSIRHGHPSTLHLWWARRPLAACRAVIFASLVDDPGDCPDEFPTEEAQRAERARLHGLLKQLVVWERSNDAHLLAAARWEIARSVARSRGESPPPQDDRVAVLNYLDDKALPIYDPFCGGGSIPLEAQRLGLRAVGSDLNPVAVLITKALIELPPKVANRPPVNPEARPQSLGDARPERGHPALDTEGETPSLPGNWRGAAGLADDVRYYGRRMREMAWARIGHLYPKARLPDGAEATVIAWLWARTVPCPNPACGVAVPLMKTFQLSRKRGNEHWTRPVVGRSAGPAPGSDRGAVSFVVQNHDEGVPAQGTVNRNGATCIACGGTAPLAYVREQARAGNLGEQMTAIVAEGDRRRLFLSPAEEHVRVARSAEPTWKPRGDVPAQARSISVQIYGFTQWHQLFTERQRAALTTLCDLVSEILELSKKDGADEQYANVICTYLALAIGREADMCSSFDRWHNAGDFVTGVFGRQGVPMIWDFAESNPFSGSTGNWMAHVEWVAKVAAQLPAGANSGVAHQADAATTIHANNGPVIVTDPPYYDNIHYADSSDFFYVWLRPLLRDIYPDLFAGIQVPKQEEMIASRFRFENPRQRFESLLNQTLRLIRGRCSPEFPSSIFYAYKQQEEEREGRTSTGWDTMLTGLVNAGFEIVGTWPMRTEMSARSNAMGANSLASSVVLVCRPRPEKAPTATRRQFLDALEAELPKALEQLTREGHIAPVDLAQAAIGPGMQVYSRYHRVETIGGEPVPVREALAAINRVIAEYDEQQQGDLDSPTRFCLDWLRQNGYREGRYGEAETLAQAKNVSVEELRDANGLLAAAAGAVKLLPLEYYAPSLQGRLGQMTAWEGTFRMAWHLSREDGRGIEGAADIYRAMGSNAESMERLARILYNHYDRKGDSRNSVLFNNLVTEWPGIQAKAKAPAEVRLL